MRLALNMLRRVETVAEAAASRVSHHFADLLLTIAEGLLWWGVICSHAVSPSSLVKVCVGHFMLHSATESVCSAADCVFDLSTLSFAIVACNNEEI